MRNFDFYTFCNTFLTIVILKTKTPYYIILSCTECDTNNHRRNRSGMGHNKSWKADD